MKIKLFSEYDKKTTAIQSMGSTPKTVKLVEILPKPGEKICYREVPLAEIEEKFHFSWQEGIVAPKEFIENYGNSEFARHFNQLPQGEKLAFQQVISSPYKKDFALYKINDAVGYGVVYVGAKTIPAKTCVDFYAGELCESEEKGADAYASKGIESKLFAVNIDGVRASSVNARAYGNITRFINCAPNQERLDNYEFSPGIVKDEVMTENLMAGKINIGEFPLRILMTTRPVQPGECLGYFYGDDYWYTQELNHGEKQCLFNKNGTLIPSYLYRLKKIAIHFSPEDKHEKQFSEYTVEQVQHVLSNPCQLGAVLDRNRQKIIGHWGAREAKQALLRNAYPACAKIDQSELHESKKRRIALSNY